MSDILLVAGAKGGGGKTTHAVNLTVQRAFEGHRVLLVDTDQNAQSASVWADLRTEYGIEPHIVCVKKSGMLAKDILAMAGDFSTIVIDAGGYDSIEMRQSMSICTRLLVLLRPSMFDAATIHRFVALIKQKAELSGEPVSAIAVLNAVSSNPRIREGAETREFLAEFADVLPLMEPTVADLLAFRTASREGKGVMELDKTSRAAQEMAAVYKEVFNV